MRRTERPRLHLPALLGLTLALAALAAGPLHAQPFHLPPVYRTPLHETDALLTVERNPAPIGSAALASSAPHAAGTEAGGVPAETRVFVSRGQLVISEPGKEPFVVATRDLTLGEVCALVRAKYGDRLLLTTSNPLLPARLLDTPPRDTLSSPVRLVANPGDPAVGLGFGAQFALNETPGDAESLLGGTGFNLDVVGVHRLMSGGDAVLGLDRLRGRGAPYAFVQWRLGLNANQQLAVSGDSLTTSGGGPPDAQGQFEDAIRQADQAVLSGQIDLVWPVFAETEFSLSLNGGVSWTKLDAFSFPLIPVPDSRRTGRDTLVAAEAVFPAALLEDVGGRLREVRPLSDFGVTALFRFNAADAVAFYAGGGVGRKEVFQRGISFRRDDDHQPDPGSLKAELHTPAAGFWRAVFGARIEGIADVRADAVGPFDRNRFPSLLRLVVSRTFPITR